MTTCANAVAGALLLVQARRGLHVSEEALALFAGRPMPPMFWR